jgi:hypothetical protein
MNPMNPNSKRFLVMATTLMMAAILMALALPHPANAFHLVGIGPRVGFTDPEGVDNTLNVGGGLDFEQAGTRFHIMPSLLYWKQDGLSDVNPNVDAMYHFSPAGHVSPYVGAGLGIHAYSQDGPDDPGTDVGMNYFGGVLFPTGGTSNLFVEARGVLADRDQFGLLGGVNFSLGR